MMVAKVILAVAAVSIGSAAWAQDAAKSDKVDAPKVAVRMPQAQYPVTTIFLNNASAPNDKILRRKQHIARL